MPPSLHRIAVATLVASFSACTLPPAAAPPPQPPIRYYSAAAKMAQGELRDSSNDESGPLTADAAKLIHPGIKIAFYPPNECETTPSEAGTGAVKEGDLIRMYCGALMSRLEAQAAKAKYEVVSWQALKHESKPPLEMARELDIDVMFEVNELSINQRELGTARATQLTFGAQTNAVDRTELAVTPDVAQRCKTQFDPEIARITPVALEAVLDAKGVEVRSGRALYYYKRGKAEAISWDEHRGLERFYPAPGKVDWTPPPRRYNTLQTGGAAVAGAGGGAMLIGAMMVGLGTAEDKEGMVKGGGALLGVGIATLAGGITMLALGNRRQKKSAEKVAYPQPSYEPPELILCAYPPATPPWLAPVPTVAAQPTTSTSFSFDEQTQGGKDDYRARREKLVREAADEFVLRLGELTR